MSSQGKHWEKFPYIYAGKDKKAGGSWLGINKYGICVAILNRKTSLKNSKNLESRGNLVINALKFKASIRSKKTKL